MDKKEIQKHFGSSMSRAGVQSLVDELAEEEPPKYNQYMNHGNNKSIIAPNQPDDTEATDGDTEPAVKRRKSRATDTSRQKGLKHFATCVCQKVQEKGVTTYSEVAEELVREQHTQSVTEGNEASEPKNIRRRVYDALNVLMALNIISKQRKEIRWIGLPTNSEQEYKQYEELKAKKIEAIANTRRQLHDLILQQIAFKNLIRRNEERELRERRAIEDSAKVPLPFIVVNTSKDAVVDCYMSHDRTEYLFKFNSPFEIHDDVDILKRMGLAFGIEEGLCSDEDLAKAKEMIPEALCPVLDDMVNEARRKRAGLSSSSSVTVTKQPSGSSFLSENIPFSHEQPNNDSFISTTKEVLNSSSSQPYDDYENRHPLAHAKQTEATDMIPHSSDFSHGNFNDENEAYIKDPTRTKFNIGSEGIPSDGQASGKRSHSQAGRQSQNYEKEPTVETHLYHQKTTASRSLHLQ